MKKVLILMLSLALLLSLGVPALAFNAQRSAQNLAVNGQTVACEKYNIDGSNYFKLRDLAQLLNGTGSQFDVGWDGVKGVVSITTSHAYTTPNGHELEVGADQSATAQVSAQTIMIDGTVRSDLTVYNIGGSNFFKLREMGDALGFDVDYDAATNTAIVASREASAPVWRLAKSTWYTFGQGLGGGIPQSVESTYSYDANGLLTLIDTAGYDQSLFEFTENGDVIYSPNPESPIHYQTTYAYDADGNCIGEVVTCLAGILFQMDSYGCNMVSITYDAAGNKLSSTAIQFDGSAIITQYAYDAHGNVTRAESTGDILTEYQNTYDALGRLILVMETGNSGETTTTSFIYDSEDRLVKKNESNSSYNLSTAYSYDSDGRLITEDASGSGLAPITTYIYDEHGNLIQKSIDYRINDWIELYTYEYEAVG